MNGYVDRCPIWRVKKTSRACTGWFLGHINSRRTYLAWEALNMDLIIDLPPSGGYDSILVIVDRFMKGAIFIPKRANFTAQTIADSFFNHGTVWEGFLPIKFITDQDPLPIKGFWKIVCAKLTINHCKTMTYHVLVRLRSGKNEPDPGGGLKRTNLAAETQQLAYVTVINRISSWNRHWMRILG